MANYRFTKTTIKNMQVGFFVFLALTVILLISAIATGASGKQNAAIGTGVSLFVTGAVTIVLAYLLSDSIQVPDVPTNSYPQSTENTWYSRPSYNNSAADYSDQDSMNSTGVRPTGYDSMNSTGVRPTGYDSMNSTGVRPTGYDQMNSTGVRPTGYDQMNSTGVRPTGTNPYGKPLPPINRDSYGGVRQRL